MTQELRISPPNSLLLIMDQSIGEVPESMDGQLVAATTSCVAIGTVSDGDVVVRLLDEQPINVQQLNRVFHGTLSTPGKQLAICSVYCEPYLVINVPDVSTELEIWADHANEPDRIYIIASQDSPKE